jgi:hypothetical protein
MADATSTVSNLTFNPLGNAVQLVKDFGFFDVVVPLILVFAVFYGILTKTEVFGKPDDTTRPLYAIISFVAAFFVIASTDVVRMIQEIIPSAAFLLIVVVLLLMLLGMFGISFNDVSLTGDNKIGWLGKVGIVVLLLIFLGIVDMSMENVEVPIVHNVAEFFVEDSGDSGDSGDAGSSSSGSSSDDGIGGMSQEDIMNWVALAVVIAFPIATIYVITKSGSK